MRVIVFAIFIVATSGMMVVQPSEDDIDVNMSYLLKCERGQKLRDLQKCIKRSIQSMRYYLKKGWAYYIVKDDVFYYESYTLHTLGHFQGFLTLYNIQIAHLGRFSVESVRITPDMTQIKFDVQFPRIALAANYYMDAMLQKIEVLTDIQNIPAQKINAAFENSQVNVTIDGHFEYRDYKNKEKKQYFIIDNVYVDLNIPWIEFHFVNIDEDADTAAEINKILKTNQYPIMRGILNQLEPDITRHIGLMADRIYSNIPMDILMPRTSR